MAAVNGSSHDDDEWCPPTEAETKVFQARRERQDRISKLLGEYLLKGYKMLGTSCSYCDTILMRSKQGVDYCVACNELDSDDVKDNPALSSSAARCLARESQIRQSGGAPDGDVLRPIASQSQDVPTSVANAVQECCQAPSSSSQDAIQPQSRQSVPVTAAAKPTAVQSKVISEAMASVSERLSWATEELRRSTSIENSCHLCVLIRSCADALQSLQRVAYV